MGKLAKEAQEQAEIEAERLKSQPPSPQSQREGTPVKAEIPSPNKELAKTEEADIPVPELLNQPVVLKEALSSYDDLLLTTEDVKMDAKEEGNNNEEQNVNKQDKVPPPNTLSTPVNQKSSIKRDLSTP